MLHRIASVISTTFILPDGLTRSVINYQSIKNQPDRGKWRPCGANIGAKPHLDQRLASWICECTWNGDEWATENDKKKLIRRWETRTWHRYEIWPSIGPPSLHFATPHAFNASDGRGSPGMISVKLKMWVRPGWHWPLILNVTIWCHCTLTLSPPIPLRLYTLPYSSNPPFLIFVIRALCHSVVLCR